MNIQKFHEIIENYKVIFLDSLGVILRNSQFIPGAESAILELNKNRKPYFIISNECYSSPEEMLAKTYNKNSNLVQSNQFISSGSLVIDFLKNKIAGSNIGFFGNPNCSVYIEEVGKKAIPLDSIKSDTPLDAFVVFCFQESDLKSEREILKSIINLLRNRPNLNCIFPNCDLIEPNLESSVDISIGSLALLIEHIVERNVIRFGKPSKILFNHAIEKAKLEIPSLDIKDILYIGDSINSDIVGGMIAGIDTCLALSGNTLKENAERELARHNLFPNFIIESIAS